MTIEFRRGSKCICFGLAFWLVGIAIALRLFRFAMAALSGGRNSAPVVAANDAVALEP